MKVKVWFCEILNKKNLVVLSLNSSFLWKQDWNHDDDTDCDPSKEDNSCQYIATLLVLGHVFLKLLFTKVAWCHSDYLTRSLESCWPVIASSYFFSRPPMYITIAFATPSFTSTPHHIVAPFAEIFGFDRTSFNIALSLWVLILYHLNFFFDLTMSGRNRRWLFRLRFTLRWHFLLLLWLRLVICHLVFPFRSFNSIIGINTNF